MVNEGKPTPSRGSLMANEVTDTSAPVALRRASAVPDHTDGTATSLSDWLSCAPSIAAR